jgi:hypothetical protein
MKFDAKLLERIERIRRPGVIQSIPGETVEDRDRRVALARLHRATIRDNLLADLHAEWADANGFIISPTPAPIATLYFNTSRVEDLAALPKCVQLLEDRSLCTVAFRNGLGRTRPHMLYHVVAHPQEIAAAIEALHRVGCRPQKLPFSFVNPRGAIAVLVGPVSRKQQ